MTATPPAEQRIMAAAFALSAERGISGVTMSAVADHAGVARQTLYNHFPDVESIVVAAYELHHEASVAGLNQVLAAADGPVAKLAQFIRYQVAAVAHGHHGAVHVSSLSPGAQQRIHLLHAQVIDMISDILIDGVASGVFRPELDVLAAASFTMHLLGGSEALVADGRPLPDVADAAETMVLLGVRG
jgi:AcrR family transcriptional regulator